MSYAPEMERVNGIAPLSRPWHGRILLLNHTRGNGVPSRTFTSNLEFRTLPLCNLSYGDQKTAANDKLPISGRVGLFWFGSTGSGGRHFSAAYKASGGTFGNADRI